jgi:hypothetical protein
LKRRTGLKFIHLINSSYPVPFFPWTEFAGKWEQRWAVSMDLGWTQIKEF